MAESGLGSSSMSAALHSPDAYPSELATILRTLQWQTLLPHQPSSTCHSSSEICHQAHVVVRFEMVLVYVAMVRTRHSSCIGNNTAAHELVHLVGMPPGGHSTPVVQKAVSHGLDECQELREGRATCRSCGDGGCCVTTRTPRKWKDAGRGILASEAHAPGSTHAPVPLSSSFFKARALPPT